MSNNFSIATQSSVKRHPDDVTRKTTSGRMLGIMTAGIILILIVTAVTAQDTGQGDGSETRADTDILSLINSTGVPYRSGNLQDPFWHPTPTKTSSKPEDEELSRGLPPPGIAGTYIAKASLEGISVGNTRRTAVVRGADDRAYFLREGDRLFDGYLKIINDDSITFVRETRMRSGKTLTQEVTKRLRTP